jgi:hypothetical protein
MPPAGQHAIRERSVYLRCAQGPWLKEANRTASARLSPKNRQALLMSGAFNNSGAQSSVVDYEMSSSLGPSEFEDDPVIVVSRAAAWGSALGHSCRGRRRHTRRA